MGCLNTEISELVANRNARLQRVTHRVVVSYVIVPSSSFLAWHKMTWVELVIPVAWFRTGF